MAQRISDNLEEFHNLKEFLNVIKSVRASFTHTDVHFASGENSSAGMLEGQATNKQKGYKIAYASNFRSAKKTDESRSERVATLLDIERPLRTPESQKSVKSGYSIF